MTQASPSPSYPFADLELARRLERAEGRACAGIVDGRRELLPERAAEWMEVNGTYAMFDGPDSPVTQTFGLGVFGKVGEDELATLEHFFRQRGAAVNHEICPLAGAELVGLLSDRGYRPIELSSVMYRPLGDGVRIEGQRRGEIAVRALASGEEELWARTAARGWSEHGDFSELMLEIARGNAARPEAPMFVAELNGEAIAAGALFLDEDVALLAGASTVPQARRQGAQLALLDHRLRFAKERGCVIAMMGAEPGSPSQRNAERHGFRLAYTRTKWQLPLEG